MANKVGLGIILALISAISWGCMGICAQYLLHYCRFQAIDLVSLRLVLAGTILLFVYRISGGNGLLSPFYNKGNFTQVLISGLAILGSQLTFMLSIKASDAALATIILTTIPVMCALYFCLVDRKLPSPSVVFCFLLASTGVGLVVTNGDISSLNFSVQGLLWGLLSAVMAAIYSIQPRSIIRKIGVCPVVGWGMIFGGIVACCFNPPWTIDVDLSWKAGMLFAFIVLVGTVLSFWSYLSSVKYLSPVLVSLIGCMEPVTAYVLSIFIYGKLVGSFELVGITFVFANVIIISIQSQKN